MAANLRQAPANLKHFRSMLDFTPAQLKNVIRSAIALKKVGRGGGLFFRKCVCFALFQQCGIRCCMAWVRSVAGRDYNPASKSCRRRVI